MRSNSKLLTHVDSEIELNMIKGLFEDNNITILVEKQGTGSYLAVHSGFNYQGSDVFVAEDDYSEALELLKVLENIDPSTETEDIQAKEIGQEQYDLKKRRFAQLAILVPIVLFVLAVIGSIIVNL